MIDTLIIETNSFAYYSSSRVRDELVFFINFPSNPSILIAGKLPQPHVDVRAAKRTA
jgi:hypothetical protein